MIDEMKYNILRKCIQILSIRLVNNFIKSSSWPRSQLCSVLEDMSSVASSLAFISFTLLLDWLTVFLIDWPNLTLGFLPNLDGMLCLLTLLLIFSWMIVYDLCMFYSPKKKTETLLSYTTIS